MMAPANSSEAFGQLICGAVLLGEKVFPILSFVLWREALAWRSRFDMDGWILSI